MMDILLSLRDDFGNFRFILKKLKEGFFITFFFFVSLSGLSRLEVVDLALYNFAGKPGLQHLLNNIIDYEKSCFPNKVYFAKHPNGALFELESALHLKDTLSHNIIGFGLDIRVSENKRRPKFNFVLDRGDYYEEGLIEIVELRETEFDVVTSDYCVECKSGRIFSDGCSKQFKKEVNMIKFFRQLKRDINFGDVMIEYSGDYLYINGDITNNCIIEFECNWIGMVLKDVINGIENRKIIDWNYIIDLLANIKFGLMFRNTFETQDFADKTKCYIELTLENPFFCIKQLGT